jgi:hypothetical protein
MKESSSFEDFKKDRDQRKSDSEKLARDAVLEWTHLEERVADFARDGEDIDGHRFQWLAEPNGEMLVLNYSAVTFRGPDWRNPLRFGIRIDRKPPGPGKMYVEDKSSVPSKKWNLAVTVEDGEFQWTIRENGWRGGTSALATEIVKALVGHYDEYKRIFPQAIEQFDREQRTNDT